MSDQSDGNLLNLTEDILIRIYEKLSSQSDAKAWRVVCREFYMVDSLSRRRLRVLRVEFLPALLRKYPRINALDLSVCPLIEDGIIFMLFTKADSVMELSWTRGLKTLVLSRTPGLRFRGMEMLARACPNLEDVDVSYCCGFGDREAAALSCCEGLKNLNMDKCLDLSDVGLAKIAVGCMKLEKLSLKWCMEISDIGVDLLCKKCLNLKSLDLSYIRVSDKSLSSVACLSKLESLALVGCSLVNDAGLLFLGNGCPSLQVIDVSRCGCISSSGLVSIISGHPCLRELNASYCLLEVSVTLMQWIKGLKYLETIRIDGTRISESCFQVISTNCKSLIDIGMSKCVGLTKMGIMQLASSCVNLRILNLTCCHSVTDVAISAIAESCQRLVVLKLECCNMMTEKGLFQLGSLCMLLEELDLTDCTGVNDKGLEYISKCSRLSCLKIGFCTNISNKGLSYISSNCKNLLELDLYRCTSIGDDGLAALSKGCKKLVKLNLSYCVEITDKGLCYVAHLAELVDLEMRGLKKVTSIGLTTVAAGCNKLTDLDVKHCEKVDDSAFWALSYYTRNLQQINLSNCSISDMTLCMLMGSLTRLQDAKLVHLRNVSVEGFELALRACCVRIKKVKLSALLRFFLSGEILETLSARGCRIRWD